jgi:hypothetical protein
MLPSSKTDRTSAGTTPMNVRVMLAGMPKAGKSTLAAAWAPDTTLIIDTQRGTTLLDGEHYVSHVEDWMGFDQVVKDLTTGEHQFKTVVIDMIDDVWNFADAYFAGKNAVLASATDDWQRSIKTAEGMFRQTIGRLLAAPLGVWFLTHTREKQDGQLTRYVPKLEPRVLTYVQGACEVILLAETLGTGRVLHTQPSAKFEAGTRIPLPEPMAMDARKLYAAMAEGLKPSQAPGKANGKTTTTKQEVAA